MAESGLKATSAGRALNSEGPSLPGNSATSLTAGPDRGGGADDLDGAGAQHKAHAAESASAAESERPFSVPLIIKKSTHSSPAAVWAGVSVSLRRSRRSLKRATTAR